ncbi:MULTISPECIES: hypothetical protein [unclassified Mycolicibacterium]|nr:MULTISPECIES: hypothetical protein [unclassified Mycolicibacterium]
MAQGVSQDTDEWNAQQPAHTVLGQMARGGGRQDQPDWFYWPLLDG